MMFLFSTSNKLGARAIKWALDQPCSHFAQVFDCDQGGMGIVFHSTLNQGVHLEWFGDWIKHNEIVFALRTKDSSLEKEEKIYQSLLKQYYGKPYDWRGFLKFSYLALRKKLTGKAIPSDIGNGFRHDYLCTELAVGLKEVAPEYVPADLPSSLIAPYDLYRIMSKSTDLQHVLVNIKNS